MNPLESHIQTRRLDSTETLNRLQDSGIISDNCVTASEVGNSADAVAWLKEEDRREKGELNL
jgi:hypothetical protein